MGYSNLCRLTLLATVGDIHFAIVDPDPNPNPYLIPNPYCNPNDKGMAHTLIIRVTVSVWDKVNRMARRLEPVFSKFPLAVVKLSLNVICHLVVVSKKTTVTVE